jgi:hypothetical protein
MSSVELTNKIESAKDSYGVITPGALHAQLSSLTPADWREAAATYPKNAAASADSFYIADDAQGTVTIHNDLSALHDVADNSVLHTTLQDAKSIYEDIGIGSGGFGVLMGVGRFLTAGVSLPEAAAAGAASGVEAGIALGVLGTVAVGGDLVRNSYRKSDAQEEIRQAQNVTLKPVST